MVTKLVLPALCLLSLAACSSSGAEDTAPSEDALAQQGFAEDLSGAVVHDGDEKIITIGKPRIKELLDAAGIHLRNLQPLESSVERCGSPDIVFYGKMAAIGSAYSECSHGGVFQRELDRYRIQYSEDAVKALIQRPRTLEDFMFGFSEGIIKVGPVNGNPSDVKLNDKSAWALHDAVKGTGDLETSKLTDAQASELSRDHERTLVFMRNSGTATAVVVTFNASDSHDKEAPGVLWEQYTKANYRVTVNVPKVLEIQSHPWTN